MAYYYQYNFISPDAAFANVKEELKSYFDTGAVDDLMFPIWMEKCLRKLGRSSYKIRHCILNVCNFECKLPPDFYSVREAWMTTSDTPTTYQEPGAYYQNISTMLNPDYNQTFSLSQGQSYPINDACNPEIVNVVYKTTTQKTVNFRLTFLLSPGNITCRNEKCDLHCINVGANAADSFDIRDNKFVTNFRNGEVYLVYYAEERNEEGFQLMPDNYRIQEYIEAFLKQKVFEQLYNQVIDETFNQIEKKLELYTKMTDEAFIMADIEVKKQDVYKKMRSIKRDLHRFDHYELDRYKHWWRRNHRP
jgi:hypothetical protein